MNPTCSSKTTDRSAAGFRAVRTVRTVCGQSIAGSLQPHGLPTTVPTVPLRWFGTPNREGYGQFRTVQGRFGKSPTTRTLRRGFAKTVRNGPDCPDPRGLGPGLPAAATCGNPHPCAHPGQIVRQCASSARPRGKAPGHAEMRCGPDTAVNTAASWCSTGHRPPLRDSPHRGNRAMALGRASLGWTVARLRTLFSGNS